MRRTAVLDPANTCSHCPHELVRLRTGTLWCPCEDCHPGGLIQGREPKDNHTVAPSYGPSIAVDALTSIDSPSGETNEDVWVDPIHQL